MKKNFYRFLKILKICTILFLFIFTVYIAISSNARRSIRTYFSSKCIGYKQLTFSRKLTDRILDYSESAKQSGIKACKNESELRELVSEGKLVHISGGRRFIVEDLSYSYPYLTKDARDLLTEISKRFRSKTEQAGISGAKFIITSLTRTTEKMKILRKNNSNASPNSPHLNGNAFDISYIRFKCHKMFITECDKRFMKEALAQVIWELSEQKKCWATYEVQQSCFHVVAR